jgi:hypothetical protein
MKELTDEHKRLLKTVVDHYDKEDRAVRERQIRTWRRLKLFWDGFQRIWYSEVAHDWRVWDEQKTGDSDQSYYEKPVNIFRAYLESIIAALSVTVPPVKCYPDDADNPLDLMTAKAGDKIATLIYRHNNAPLLWLHALFIFCTEGMTACYNYTKEDEKFGTYQKDRFKEETEEVEKAFCPQCGSPVEKSLIDQEKDEFDPEEDDVELHHELNEGKMLCPECMAEVDPEIRKEKLIVTKFVGKFNHPKARQCLEIYGGLYVKIPAYARKQPDCPYLIFSYETDFALARDRYPDLRDKITQGSGGAYEPYERWGRMSPQYYGEYPLNNVTVRNAWLRPAAFEVLSTEDETRALKKRFPDGARVVLINEEFAEAENESLDDHWTLSYNPLSDHLHHDPLGLLLTSIQEITNDLISLVLQTIEHGIPQTIADPSVLNFDAYRQMEATPGMIIPGTPRTGKSMGDSFHEVKTATLSGETLPFANKIQEYGQLVSGALPAIFGGALAGGKTASEYSMSRAQALQRLQNTWKIFTFWWKEIFGKVIPAYIKTVEEDERDVNKDDFGNFINVFIRKAELEGKIGKVELEANENLPITWNQIKDTIMQLMQSNNPQILAMIAQPENLQYIYEAIGLTDFYVPGQDSREKQYEEIKQLLNSEPIIQPPDEMAVQAALETGQMPQETELPSVDVDPIFDIHPIEFEVCRKWITSEAGRLAKTENGAGYRNMLLHAQLHHQFMMQAQMLQEQGNAPLESPKENTEVPIQGEEDVQVQ